MLLQTNSYLVPHEKRVEHAKLLRRFRQMLIRLGCESFEIYEQVGPNWNASQSSGRFVQIMQFKDRRQQLAVQQAEKSDPNAQKLIAEFCELINFPYQQQQSLFATSFYTSLFGNESTARGELPRDQVEEAPQPPSVFAKERIAKVAPEAGAPPLIDLDAHPPADAPAFNETSIAAAHPDEMASNDELVEGPAEDVIASAGDLASLLGSSPENGKSRGKSIESRPPGNKSHQPRQLIEPLEERSIHAEADDGFEGVLDELDEA